MMSSHLQTHQTVPESHHCVHLTGHARVACVCFAPPLLACLEEPAPDEAAAAAAMAAGPHMTQKLSPCEYAVCPCVLHAWQNASAAECARKQRAAPCTQRAGSGHICVFHLPSAFMRGSWAPAPDEDDEGDDDDEADDADEEEAAAGAVADAAADARAAEGATVETATVAVVSAAAAPVAPDAAAAARAAEAAAADVAATPALAPPPFGGSSGIHTSCISSEKMRTARRGRAAVPADPASHASGLTAECRYFLHCMHCRLRSAHSANACPRFSQYEQMISSRACAYGQRATMAPVDSSSTVSPTVSPLASRSAAARKGNQNARMGSNKCRKNTN
jgi:hypothetical protein